MSEQALLDEIDLLLANAGMGFNAYVERNRRMHRIVALRRKSDRELARMGLTRAEVPAFVFRDLIAA